VVFEVNTSFYEQAPNSIHTRSGKFTIQISLISQKKELIGAVMKNFRNISHAKFVSASKKKTFWGTISSTNSPLLRCLKPRQKALVSNSETKTGHK